MEANFDGLVGPTHNYAGLSDGNIASKSNAKDKSHPKAAALQGLSKAKALKDRGFVQGILAPHARPDILMLKRLGFTGSDKQIIEKVAKGHPELLTNCYSSSAMWTANAATVSPSADTYDGRVHFTPANLSNKLHRSIEPELTGRILKQTFRDDKFFHHHSHLPSGLYFGDEGAANHTRFCKDYSEKGVEFFVFGNYSLRQGMPAPKVYPARQSFEASQAVARLHGLDMEKVVFAQQNPDVIDQGVFHNDVISVGNGNVYFYHEQALLDSDAVLSEIAMKLDSQLHSIMVPTKSVSVQDAVSSYLFNSQLLTKNDGKMVIVVPEECRANPAVWSYLTELEKTDKIVNEVLVMDVTESMKNGGGPACLRLRVALTDTELGGVNPQTLLTDSLYTQLTKWVEKHYRDQFLPSDLADPSLIDEVRFALDELTQIMDLGSVYDFQI